MAASARRLGAHTRPALYVFAVLTVLLMMACVTAAGLGWPAKLGVIGVAIHLAWQAMETDFDDAKDCDAKFKSNRFIGWILLAGLVLAKLMQ